MNLQPPVFARRRFLLRSLPVKPGPRTLFHDAFSDPNGTALDDHTPAPVNKLGAAWVEEYRDWVISANNAVSTGNTGRLTLSSGLANCALRTAVKTTLDNLSYYYDGAILVRSDGAGRHFRLGFNPAGDALTITEVSNPAEPWGVTRATASRPLDTGVYYELSAVLSGNTLQVAIGGTTCSYTSAALAGSTRHGVYSSGTQFYDYFLVTTL